MNKSMTNLNQVKSLLPKSPSGIRGLDEILNGGLPKNRCTLLCGGPGTGKTLFAMEFILHGAMQYNEPGVFITFEEKPENLNINLASFGFDLNGLVIQKKVVLDFIYIDRDAIKETGEYDLEGLFIRLEQAISAIGAKRIVLDTIESLFSIFSNPFILRSELRRLFLWLNDRGVTSIVTGELGTITLTRQGLEEYISDCVIRLDNRIHDLTATRRLRVVKYRGSMHEMNEFPFLISENGIWILPLTSPNLSEEISNKRISCGIPTIDNMLSGGYYCGSSVLMSGMAGTGKSSFAAHLADAACRRGERVLYFAFEETKDEIIRNMHSIGIDLEQWVKKGLLQFHICRTTDFGLEQHLLLVCKATNLFKPQIAIVDSVSAFDFGSNIYDVKKMMIRLIAFFKSQKVTSFITNLISSDSAVAHTRVGVSSLIDAWVVLRYSEIEEERKRFMYIVKSRGTSISNQICEYQITEHGVKLC